MRRQVYHTDPPTDHPEQGRCGKSNSALIHFDLVPEKFKVTAFFLSSCCFAMGWICQLALDAIFPIPLYVLDEYRPSPLALLLGAAFFSTVVLGLLLFVVGIARIITGRSTLTAADEHS
jgi:hypothetical protein